MISQHEILEHSSGNYIILYYVEPDSSVLPGASIARIRDPYSGGLSEPEIGTVVSFNGFGFYFEIELDIGGQTYKFERTGDAFAVIQRVP